MHKGEEGGIGLEGSCPGECVSWEARENVVALGVGVDGPVVRLGRRVKRQCIFNLIKTKLDHFVYDALVGRNR